MQQESEDRNGKSSLKKNSLEKFKTARAATERDIKGHQHFFVKTSSGMTVRIMVEIINLFLKRVFPSGESLNLPLNK